jgi:hypothetical protein
MKLNDEESRLRITPSILAKFYHSQRITKIFLVKRYSIESHRIESLRVWYRNSRLSIMQTLEENRRIVFIDESTFSALTRIKTAFSKKQ